MNSLRALVIYLFFWENKVPLHNQQLIFLSLCISVSAWWAVADIQGPQLHSPALNCSLAARWALAVWGHYTWVTISLKCSAPLKTNKGSWWKSIKYETRPLSLSLTWTDYCVNAQILIHWNLVGHVKLDQPVYATKPWLGNFTSLFNLFIWQEPMLHVWFPHARPFRLVAW